jgi:streptomycin 6-kinase
MRIPKRLEWRRSTPEGAAWLDRVPRLVARCAERWSLDIGRTFPYGAMSVVLAATRADGTPAVLKLTFPEPASERERDALAYWNGEGAVQLLEYDAEANALLLERCLPGTPLDADDDAVMIAVALLRRLWREPPPAHDFRPLREEADHWAEEIPTAWEHLRRPFERDLVDAALDVLRDLDDGRPVVLHGDFHGANVLRAERQPWLAIDPIPLVGEREFDAGSLVRDSRDPRAALEHVAAELGLDRERVRGWGIANALGWGISETKLEWELVERARLLRRHEA